MKKILNLTGIQKLTKEDQQQIKGSWGRHVYYRPPRKYCQMFNGFEFCDFGYCQNNGTCIWT